MTRVFVVFSIHEQQIPSWFRKWQFFEIKIEEVDDTIVVHMAQGIAKLAFKVTLGV
jgi:hypothetical protein